MSDQTWKTELGTFFSPCSIAIIGASEVPGSFTRVAYEYLIQFGFKGHIFPVNPNHKEVWGIRCYSSIKEINTATDVAIIAVQAKIVPEVLEECGKKGIQNAIVFSSGFGEAGTEEGLRLQSELVTISDRYRIRVGGPNCIGFACTKTNTVCFSAPLPRKIPSGCVGYISQSATMAANVVSAGASSGIGFAYVVSTGNEAVLDFCDYTEFMLNDPDVRVVAGFVEGIKDAEKFAKVAERAARVEKPIVVLKIGKSIRGKQAAASHTGSMTGSYEVYRAFFRQNGIIMIETIEQMVETIKLFSYRKPISRGSIAIVAGSGGVCGYLSDRCAEVGLELSDFGPETRMRLKGTIPSFGTVHNPLDITAQSRTEPEVVTKACEIIAADEQIDIVIFGLGMTKSILSDYIKPILIRFADTASAYPQKLFLFLSCNTEEFTPAIHQFVRDYGVPLLQGGRAALEAVKSLIEYERLLSERREKKPEIFPIASETSAKWRQYLRRRRRLLEKEAKSLLQDYGIQVPKGKAVHTVSEAVEAACEIGYPVVLKIQSTRIFHKSDIGGVRLNLRDEKSLWDAFVEMENIIKGIGPFDGFLLEEMVCPGVEMILGMKSDPLLGPVVMLGSGGIFTEILNDYTCRVLPLDRRDAREMIHEVRIAKLLQGFRGGPRYDIESLEDAILRLARIAEDLSEEISEIDINPLVVLTQDRGVVAVDALFLSKK